MLSRQQQVWVKQLVKCCIGKGKRMVIGFGKHKINMKLSASIFLRFHRDFFFSPKEKSKVRAAPNASDFKVQKPLTTSRKF